MPEASDRIKCDLRSGAVEQRSLGRALQRSGKDESALPWPVLRIWREAPLLRQAPINEPVRPAMRLAAFRQADWLPVNRR
jgi:hypothetical protein